MYPILLEWGPIRIGSYGVLLALAFSGSIIVTNREFRKHRTDLNLAWDIYLLAILGGLIGSKALFALENWQEFTQSPVSVLFTTAGFSVIGGYLLAVSMCAVRVRMAGEPFLKIADLTSPGMAIGYAIGRLGCITAGDGCYGLPTKAWVGMTFPNGLVPTLAAKNPHLVKKFMELFPSEAIPKDIAVHPTPLYESLSMWLLLAILLLYPWKIGPGRRFAMFLAWFGVSRFAFEFIRLNPPWLWGYTSDQWLSVGVFMGALVLLVWKRNDSTSFNLS